MKLRFFFFSFKVFNSITTYYEIHVIVVGKKRKIHHLCNYNNVYVRKVTQRFCIDAR